MSLMDPDNKDNKNEGKFRKLTEKPWFQLAMALGLVVVLYFLLQNLGTIWRFIAVLWNFIVPLIDALIVAYIVDAFVRVFENHVLKKMKKRKLARSISIVVGMVLILLVLAAILWLLIPQLAESVETLVNNLSDYMVNFQKWLSEIGGGIFADQVEDLQLKDFGKTLIDWLSGLISGDSVISASLSVGTGIINAVVVVILAVYYLFDKERLIKGAERFFRFALKEKKYKPFSEFCSRCNRILVRYICCTLLEAIAVGAVTAVVMLIFRMPYVPLISLLIAATNLVPTFGPIVGAVIGGFLLILINPVHALVFLIAVLVIQLLDGYVLKPRLFAGTLGVPALLILISVIILGRIFGVIGMLLGIPAAAIIEYIYRTAQDYRAKKNNI